MRAAVVAPHTAAVTNPAVPARRASNSEPRPRAWPTREHAARAQPERHGERHRRDIQSDLMRGEGQLALQPHHQGDGRESPNLEAVLHANRKPNTQDSPRDREIWRHQRSGIAPQVWEAAHEAEDGDELKRQTTDRRRRDADDAELRERPDAVDEAVVEG